MAEIIGNNAYAILSVIMLVIATLFAKVVIRIFKLGVTFNTELVSKQELKDYKREIKDDLRQYKEELTNVVMQSCFQVLREKLKDLDKYQDIEVEIKKQMAEMEIKSNDISEKYNEMKSVVDTVKILNNKVNTLQYGQGSTQGDSVRRSAK